MTVIERHGGSDRTRKYTGDGSSAKITCDLFPYTNDEAAHAAFDASLDASIIVRGKVLVLDTTSVKHREADIYQGTASYIDPAKQEEEEPEVDALEISIDTTGEQTHITQSYETKAFPDGADSGRHKNAINVKHSKNGAQVEGIDVIVPSLNFQITKYLAPPADPFALARAVAAVTARINDAAWYGFKKGELLFLGARIKGKSTEKWTIEYQFSASSNIEAADNFEIPGLGVVTKLGHDYFWVEYEPVEAENALLMKPSYAYSERIYRFANFGSLGLGS